MRRRWGVVALAVALVAVVAPQAMAVSENVLGLYLSADPNAEGCPASANLQQDRDGNIDTALTYLRSLVNHDTSTLRVGEFAKRWEEGGQNAKTGKELCKGNQGPVTIEDAVIDMRQMKWWVVDGDESIAMYYLDSPTSPTYIAERFKVDDGLIQEIEAIFYVDTTGLVVGPESLSSKPESQEERVFDTDQGPAGFYSPVNKRGLVANHDRDEVSSDTTRSSAEKYLAALVSHDASAVPFADHVSVQVNRRDESRDAEALKTYIESDATNRISRDHPMTHLTDHPLVYVEGDSAIAMYMVTSSAQDAVGLGAVAGLPDLWVATRFKVDKDGNITDLETVCNGSQYCGFSS